MKTKDSSIGGDHTYIEFQRQKVIKNKTDRKENNKNK